MKLARLLVLGLLLATPALADGLSVSRKGQYQCTGTGCVSRPISSKLGDFVSVCDFETTCPNGSDDTAAIQAAITATGNGGTVWLPAGVYRTTSCLTLRDNLKIQGAGHGKANTGPTSGTKILNSVSDIFCNSSSNIAGVVFEGFLAESQAGGGHVFNWSSAGIVSNVEMRDVVLMQDNAAKAVVQATSAGGVFEINLHNFNASYVAANSVPAFNFANTALSHVTLEHCIIYGPNTSDGTYAVWFEGVTNIATQVVVRDCAFEQTGGGMVNYLSTRASGMETSRIWDLSVVPNNPLVNVGKSASNVSGSSLWFLHQSSIFSGTETAAKPSVRINGPTIATLRESHVNWLDGVTAGANGIWLTESAVANEENLAYQRTQGSNNDDFCFNTTAVGAHSHCLYNDSSNDIGWFKITRDGTFIGGWNSGGTFIWGGTATSPNASTDTSGNMRTASKFTNYLGINTAGIGVPAIFGTPVLLTGQTANLAATNVYAAAPVGEYEVCATARTTTSGSGTTATLNIIWTDEGGVKTDLVGTWALNSVTVTGQINKCEYIHAAAASNIQVSVTAGTYGTSAYAISATATRVN